MSENTTFWVLLLSFAILLIFALLCLGFWFSWRVSQRPYALSPYTGTPLRRATDLSYYAAEKTLRYLYELQQYDNRVFRLSHASFCRDTGRIFTNSVTWLDVIHVDWTFLKKRYPGNYVSWGSLNKEQKQAIEDVHNSLEGFQTEISSPNPAPRGIEPDYVYAVPGPLYVDMETKVLLGWKEVPGTSLEVLIVQKPVR